MKFVSSIITVYLPKSDEIVEPESIYQAPSIPKHIQSTNLFDRLMTEEIAVQNFSRRRQTRKPFSGIKGLVILFVVTTSPIKAIASVQSAGNGIQKTGENGCNVPFVNIYFTNLTVLHLYGSEIMMKWRVLTLFCINMYRITQKRYSVFLSMTVKSTSCFPVFSVGRNEHKFVICFRVHVQYFD